LLEFISLLPILRAILALVNPDVTIHVKSVPTIGKRHKKLPLSQNNTLQ